MILAVALKTGTGLPRVGPLDGSPLRDVFHDAPAGRPL